MDNSTRDRLMEAWEEYHKKQIPTERSADQWDLRRLNNMIERQIKELDMYYDFQLWVKFTHPDIINEYKAIKDIERSV